MSVPLVDVELVLGLGEKDFAGVIVSQQLAARLSDFTAVGLAEQNTNLIFALPTQQNRASAILEQQQRGQRNRRNLFQLALQQTPLQPGASRCAWQQFEGSGAGWAAAGRW
jgi:hypothetical protein